MEFCSFMIYLLFFASLCVADKSCGSNYSEGDKWFDGCNWCVCEDNEQKCTHSTCEHLTLDKDLSPCHELGESWRDGCFHCRCLPDGIRCKINKRCLSTLRDVQPSECSNKDLCICGLDGVPSCTKEIVSRITSKTLPFLTSGNYGKLIPSAKDNGDLNLNADDTENEFSDKSLSLMPVGNDPCQVGPRWYGGGFRCYCDRQNGVMCGNPRFIARKVDGFKIRKKKCVEGQIWEERCHICTCKIDGFSFCRIDRECAKNKKIRHSALVEKSSCSGISCRVSTGDSQCKIGERWREGCKRCRCNKRGKIICKSRLCNQSGNDKTDRIEDIQSRRISTGVRMRTKTSFRLPSKPSFRMPNFSNSGMKFKRKKRPHITPVNCKGFKPGEKYWDKCNLCHCTYTGSPMCSSKLC